MYAWQYIVEVVINRYRIAIDDTFAAVVGLLESSAGDDIAPDKFGGRHCVNRNDVFFYIYHAVFAWCDGA